MMRGHVWYACKRKRNFASRTGLVVTHIAPFQKVDDILGDVGRMISYALQVMSDED